MDWEPIGAAEPNLDPNTGEVLNPGEPLEWRRRRPMRDQLPPDLDPANHLLDRVLPDVHYDSDPELSSASDDEPVALAS